MSQSFYTKKIAIIGSRGIPAEFGGFETFAEQISLRLVNAGVHVTVFCEDSQKYKESEYQGVSLVHIKTANLVGFRSIWFDFVSILKTLRGYDVVYMLGYHAGFLFFIPFIFGVEFWTNMDGLEWKRSKWSFFARKYLKINEFFAAKFSRRLIADAEGIADHLNKNYNTIEKTVTIPYGADIVKEPPESSFVFKNGLRPDRYYLVVCRLEPENHVQQIIKGFLESNSTCKLAIIGDFSTGTPYVEDLQNIAEENVCFLGTIFDKNLLISLRWHCKAYIHGHSVGGTNPSLLEAMACKNYVIAHNNIFNREVTGGMGSFFNNEKELASIIKSIEKDLSYLDVRETLFKRVLEFYNWEKIVFSYLELIEKINKT